MSEVALTRLGPTEVMLTRGRRVVEVQLSRGLTSGPPGPPGPPGAKGESEGSDPGDLTVLFDNRLI